MRSGGNGASLIANANSEKARRISAGECECALMQQNANVKLLVNREESACEFSF